MLFSPIILCIYALISCLFNSNSIYAQRTVERLFITPDTNVVKQDVAYSGQPMAAVAHPDLKASTAGLRGSYDAAVAFADEAKARRDELLAKYAAAETAEE